MISSVREDYLKAIYELEEAVGIARTTQLAKKLAIRAATVSEMVQRLSKESTPLISYQHHHGVHLTPAGRKEALNIIRRHRLLETFLHHTLGLSWDEVHEEAEILEHHLSPRVTEALDRHLGFPRYDPHGEPIPDQQGQMQPRSQVPLSQVAVGKQFVVTSVKPISAELLVYLKDLGIGIQTVGRLLSKSPLEGPLTIEINCENKTCQHSLGRNVADHIWVEVT